MHKLMAVIFIFYSSMLATFTAGARLFLNGKGGYLFASLSGITFVVPSLQLFLSYPSISMKCLPTTARSAYCRKNMVMWGIHCTFL